MKKLLLVAVGLLLMVGVVRAEINIGEELKKLPAVNQAVIYSIDDSDWDYATTLTAVSWTVGKVPMKLDLGYTPKNEAIVATTVKLVEVKDYLNYPILKYLIVEPGVYAGLKRIAIGPGNAKDNNDFDYGVILKLAEVKF